MHWLKGQPFFIILWHNFPVLIHYLIFQRRTLRSETIFDNWKPFKNDEKMLFFHLKCSSLSQDINVFVMTFCSCRKNGSIRKIRLISKFMTSQPVEQTIIIQILPNIWRSKGIQAMRFGQLIQYNVTRRTFFLKNHAQNVLQKLFPDPYLKNQNWAYLWINSVKF